MTPATTQALHAILVPLDGSVFAEQALETGVSLAAKAGAVLHLVSVHEPMPVAAMPIEMPVAFSDFDERSRDNLAEYLESVSARVRAGRDLTVTTGVITGRAARSLCEYVEAQRVDLVVMSTHGRGGPSRWWLGSVADGMLRHLSTPILLLHPHEGPGPREFGHLLLALDGEIEEPLIDAALALSGPAGGARWVVTRVVEPTVPVLSGLAARPAHLPLNWNEHREIEARNYLARLADRLRARGVDATPQVLVGRGVAAQVLDLGKALGTHCIVVGTHGASGLERVLLGSVADKIVRGAEIPVLVAPAAVRRRR